MIDDAQAMALVKEYFLRIEWLASRNWVALHGGNNAPAVITASSEDLNQAIEDCVAKVRAAA